MRIKSSTRRLPAGKGLRPLTPIVSTRRGNRIQSEPWKRRGTNPTQSSAKTRPYSVRRRRSTTCRRDGELSPDMSTWDVYGIYRRHPPMSGLRWAQHVRPSGPGNDLRRQRRGPSAGNLGCRKNSPDNLAGLSGILRARVGGTSPQCTFDPRLDRNSNHDNSTTQPKERTFHQPSSRRRTSTNFLQVLLPRVAGE